MTTRNKPNTSSLLRRSQREKRYRYHPERERRSRQIGLLESALHKAVSELIEARQSAKSDDKTIIQYREQALRLQADFDNFRKRANREKEDIRKFALQEFVEKLLLPLDSFDHALKAIGPEADVAAIAQGIEAIYKQLDSTLRSIGLEKIDAEGKIFDPAQHEALLTESNHEMPKNTITQVLQNGYILNGRLVRPARVKIVKND